MAKLDLLVLDELGYVPASKVGSELLFDVISTAYERTSLIVTTNLPFENWTEVLGSERLTGATLDRLTHRCRIIETKVRATGSRDAKARTRRTTAKTHTNPWTGPSLKLIHDQQCCRFRPFRASVFDRDSQLLRNEFLRGRIVAGDLYEIADADIPHIRDLTWRSSGPNERDVLLLQWD